MTVTEQLLREAVADLVLEVLRLREQLALYQSVAQSSSELLFEGMTGLPPDRRRFALEPDAEVLVASVRGAGSG